MNHTLDYIDWFHISQTSGEIRVEDLRTQREVVVASSWDEWTQLLLNTQHLLFTNKPILDLEDDPTILHLKVWNVLDVHIRQLPSRLESLDLSSVPFWRRVRELFQWKKNKKREEKEKEPPNQEEEEEEETLVRCLPPSVHTLCVSQSACHVLWEDIPDTLRTIVVRLADGTCLHFDRNEDDFLVYNTMCVRMKYKSALHVYHERELSVVSKYFRNDPIVSKLVFKMGLSSTPWTQWMPNFVHTLDLRSLVQNPVWMDAAGLFLHPPKHLRRLVVNEWFWTQLLEDKEEESLRFSLVVQRPHQTKKEIELFQFEDIRLVRQYFLFRSRVLSSDPHLWKDVSFATEASYQKLWKNTSVSVFWNTIQELDLQIEAWSDSSPIPVPASLEMFRAKQLPNSSCLIHLLHTQVKDLYLPSRFAHRLPSGFSSRQMRVHLDGNTYTLPGEWNVLQRTLSALARHERQEEEEEVRSHTEDLDRFFQRYKHVEPLAFNGNSYALSTKGGFDESIVRMFETQGNIELLPVWLNGLARNEIHKIFRWMIRQPEFSERVQSFRAFFSSEELAQVASSLFLFRPEEYDLSTEQFTPKEQEDVAFVVKTLLVPALWITQDLVWRRGLVGVLYRLHKKNTRSLRTRELALFQQFPIANFQNDTSLSSFVYEGNAYEQYLSTLDQQTTRVLTVLQSSLYVSERVWKQARLHLFRLVCLPNENYKRVEMKILSTKDSGNDQQEESSFVKLALIPWYESSSSSSPVQQHVRKLLETLRSSEFLARLQRFSRTKGIRAQEQQFSKLARRQDVFFQMLQQKTCWASADAESDDDGFKLFRRKKNPRMYMWGFYGDQDIVLLLRKARQIAHVPPHWVVRNPYGAFFAFLSHRMLLWLTRMNKPSAGGLFTFRGLSNVDPTRLLPLVSEVLMSSGRRTNEHMHILKETLDDILRVRHSSICIATSTQIDTAIRFLKQDQAVNVLLRFDIPAGYPFAVLDTFLKVQMLDEREVLLPPDARWEIDKLDVVVDPFAERPILFATMKHRDAGATTFFPEQLCSETQVVHELNLLLHDWNIETFNAPPGLSTQEFRDRNTSCHHLMGWFLDFVSEVPPVLPTQQHFQNYLTRSLLLTSPILWCLYTYQTSTFLTFSDKCKLFLQFPIFETFALASSHRAYQGTPLYIGRKVQHISKRIGEKQAMDLLEEQRRHHVAKQKMERSRSVFSKEIQEQEKEKASSSSFSFVDTLYRRVLYFPSAKEERVFRQQFETLSSSSFSYFCLFWSIAYVVVGTEQEDLLWVKDLRNWKNQHSLHK